MMAGQAQCVGHCRHSCPGRSTPRLWGGRSLSQELHHGSRCRGRGEAGGQDDGRGGEVRGDGRVGADRTSCPGPRGVGGGALEAGDDSRVVGGPCRARGSRASGISTGFRGDIRPGLSARGLLCLQAGIRALT